MLSGGMLRGIALLLDSFGQNMKDDIFKEKVGAYSARDVSRTAKERRKGSMGFAEAMLIAYNKNRKTSLPWAKLLKKKAEFRRNEYAIMQEG